MYSPEFEYYRAGSVAEATDLLGKHPDAKLLAGGHSLIPILKLRLAAPSALIDIGRVEAMRGIESSAGNDPHRRIDDACGAGCFGQAESERPGARGSGPE